MRIKFGLKAVRSGLILGMVFLASCSSYEKVKYAKSFDGERIAYQTAGQKSAGTPQDAFRRMPATRDVTLIFVHGWSCDGRYWREQVPVFEKKYRVVTVDLAGHGNSGQNRKIYSVESFAQDVKAVMKATDAKNVILIGHSFGGEIVATAASEEPNRVIGIIGVDTLQNVEEWYSREEASKLIGIDGFKKDFKPAVKAFVEQMMVKDVNQALLKWIIDDMSSAPPDVAISALEEYTGTIADRKMISVFREVRVPVRCINADQWPTNPEANRRHMSSFDFKIMKGVGHFPMLERPEEFNKLLEESIEEIMLRK